MSTRLIVACALTALLAGPAFGQETRRGNVPRAEAQFSDDTLQLRYVGSGQRLGTGQGSNWEAAVFLSEERDLVVSGGVMFPAQLELGRLSLTFGPQAFAALLEEENNDILALTAGTEIRYALDRAENLAIVGRAFYAPDILTFGAADNLTDLSARAEIRLAPQLIGFAGMRWFEFDLIDGQGERTLQEEVFIGIAWRL